VNARDHVAEVLRAIPGMITGLEVKLTAKQRLQVERRVGQQLRADLAAERDQLVDQAAKQGDLEEVVRVAVEQAVAGFRPTDALLDRKAAARHLGVSLRALDRLAIPRVRLGRLVRFRVADLDQHAGGLREMPAHRPTKPQPSRATKRGRAMPVRDRIRAALGR